jgi:ADP-ribosyl-[dinitrogen reductase] hydrolase
LVCYSYRFSFKIFPGSPEDIFFNFNSINIYAGHQRRLHQFPDYYNLYCSASRWEVIMEIRERYLGCLQGLAAADAVGTTVEFKSPGSFEPLVDMVGGGPFGLKPGEWTDDTSMALCLADSLVEKQDFDLLDQIERYSRWQSEGYLSSNGRCFDIGNTVAASLRRFKQNNNPYCGSVDPNSAGNGSIMRLAPVAMAYASLAWKNPEQGFPTAVDRCGESSKTTHALQVCIDACRYLGSLLVGALNGAEKDELLGGVYSPIEGYWEKHPVDPVIAGIAAGSFRLKKPPVIRGKGYVVDSLEAALWAFHHSHDFREGCLLAVNLGDDADTTGAVYGQLAGAFYGENAIPASWRERLAHREWLVNYADRLYRLASSIKM